jgi:hypothetical protein
MDCRFFIVPVVLDAAQMPAVHFCPLAQTVPHTPQLLESVSTFTQVRPHATLSAAHRGVELKSPCVVVVLLLDFSRSEVTSAHPGVTIVKVNARSRNARPILREILFTAIGDTSYVVLVFV